MRRTKNFEIPVDKLTRSVTMFMECVKTSGAPIDNAER